MTVDLFRSMFNIFGSVVSSCRSVAAGVGRWLSAYVASVGARRRRPRRSPVAGTRRPDAPFHSGGGMCARGM